MGFDFKKINWEGHKKLRSEKISGEEKIIFWQKSSKQKNAQEKMVHFWNSLYEYHFSIYEKKFRPRMIFTEVKNYFHSKGKKKWFFWQFLID